MARYRPHHSYKTSRRPRSYRRLSETNDDDGAGFCFAIVLALGMAVAGVVYIVESFDDKRKLNVAAFDSHVSNWTAVHRPVFEESSFSVAVSVRQGDEQLPPRQVVSLTRKHTDVVLKDNAVDIAPFEPLL